MDDQTLRNMISKVAQANQEAFRTEIIWHGGEPLLAGIGFHRRALQIQQEIAGHSFVNSLMTNGTLLDAAWLDFFQENRFRVSISIDGPEEIHNANRPYRDGAASFHEVLAAILELKRRKMSCGSICVLNRNSLSSLEPLYGFFKAHRINPKFNAQLPTGRALENRELGISPLEYAKAMIWLFDRWFHDFTEPVIRVEPFVTIMGNIGAFRNTMTRLHYPVGCIFKKDCTASFVAVSPDGSVYPCGRWAGEKSYLMGNINHQTMAEMMESPARKLLASRCREAVTGCTGCEYRPICNAGCPDNAFIATGNPLGKDVYCPAYKMLFKHIEAAMGAELEVSG